MKILDFVKMYAENRNAITIVVLEFFWSDDGIDEEYCFEGTPEQFMEKYTKDYNCIDDLTIFDCMKLTVSNDGKSQIYIEVVRD